MKKISLGSAHWGWSVSEKEANDILNLFYDNGGRFVDSAFNYPISSTPNDLNKSFIILSDWIKRNNINDLKINYKIGSISNEYLTKNNTSEEYLRDQINYAVDILSNNIHSIMIHWDNSKSINKIRNTCIFLKEIQDSGLSIGLSGIKHPKIYADLMSKLNFSPIDLQVKSNFIYSKIDHYKPFSPLKNRYWAYGISSGGIKIEELNQKNKFNINTLGSANKNLLAGQEMIEKIRLAIEKNKFNSFYELSIYTAENNDSLYGYIIGPSKKSQMKNIINFLALKF